MAAMRHSPDARVVVLVSGSGSNLQALLDDPAIGPGVVGVLSDRADAGGLTRAARAGVTQRAVVPADFPARLAWEAALAAAVAAQRPQLVVLAGFMRILSAAFVQRWPILNVHPSLLPAFPGARAVEEALAWGVKLTGCTVHFVDEQVDHGPIVAQEAVPVAAGDSAATLHARIQEVEHRLLPAAVRLFLDGRLAVDGRHVRITS
jgi:phosphoribosylglycinamide formyltransferase 1